MNDSSIAYFDKHGENLIQNYQELDRASVLKPFLAHIDMLYLNLKRPLKILDVGAGIGADAEFLTQYIPCEIFAVEPSKTLKKHAKPNKKIQWLDDTLPHLKATIALKHKFDLILCDSVFQYIERKYHIKVLTKCSMMLNHLTDLAAVALLYPTTPTKPHQYKLNKNMLIPAINEARLEIKSFQSIASMGERKNKNGDALFFEYLVLTIKN